MMDNVIIIHTLLHHVIGYLNQQQIEQLLFAITIHSTFPTTTIASTTPTPISANTFLTAPLLFAFIYPRYFPHRLTLLNFLLPQLFQQFINNQMFAPRFGDDMVLPIINSQ